MLNNAAMRVGMDEAELSGEVDTHTHSHTYFQGDLFAHARNTDPATSHKAARSVRNQATIRDEVIQVLRLFGPMTDEALLERIFARKAVRATPSGIRTRRAELVDAGLVEPTEHRARTRSGREALVWRLAK